MPPGERLERFDVSAGQLGNAYMRERSTARCAQANSGACTV
jgi:hypothetical protein